VLSTDALKSIYDRYGEHILKSGTPGKTFFYLSHFDLTDQSHHGYSFNGDPMEIFESFFGTTNPFHIAVDVKGQQIPLV
jgi:DnaJ-class molecular chaperone